MTECFGRRVILSNASTITDRNIVEILDKSMITHNKNRREIEYLWNYYKGDQPILYRKKTLRPEICNHIVENRANEIVSFKVGYLCGEPIQYISRNGKENTVSDINVLNEMMFSVDKFTLDQEVIEWGMICGTAFRMVLPRTDDEQDYSDSPFEIFTMDPRDTFVVYSTEIGNKPLLGVKYSKNEAETELVYSVYSKNWYWKIEGSKILESRAHALGMIPIFEYPANKARLGAFEIVMPLLDAINNTQSNRMDGVEQFLQAFWKFIGCKISQDDFEKFLQKGAIVVPPNDSGGNIDVDLVVKELNQNQTQTLKDDLYNAVLTICGMPNRNGGSSTSDTGAAVLLRDGWSLAEARAKDSEHAFKKSEKQMLRLVLRICREFDRVNLQISDIEFQFTRRNYENIQNKSQVLCSMLNQDKIHPLLAFQHSGMFVDPENAYSMSKKYYDEKQEEASKNLNPVVDQVTVTTVEK